MSTANTMMHAFKVVTIEMTTLRAKMCTPCMTPLTSGDRQRAVADRRETVHAEPANAASETVLDRAWNSVLSEGDNSWIGKHFTSLTIHGAVMPLGESVLTAGCAAADEDLKELVHAAQNIQEAYKSYCSGASRDVMVHAAKKIQACFR